MDNFDLKKYLSENRLNEGVNSGQGSAIEWLEKRFYFTEGQLIDIDFEQAKAKEIENIKNAFNYGQTDPGIEADEYLDFINFK